MTYQEFKDSPDGKRLSKSQSLHDKQMKLQMDEVSHGFDWDYVMVFDLSSEPTTKDFPDKDDLTEAQGKWKEQKKILNALRQAGLLINKKKSESSEGDMVVRITAKQPRLEEEADRINYTTQLKEKYEGGFTDFEVSKRDFFKGTGEDEFRFRKVDRLRLIFSIIKAKRNQHGAGVDIEHFKNSGVLKQCFPLHENLKLEKLADVWARKKFTPQPLDHIRDYFGEKIAIYFAWLGFYTRWLLAPAIIGLLVFGYGTTQKTVNNPLVPSFAVLMAFWSTFFMEAWKREQITLSVRWGMTEYEEQEQPRPQFKGDKKVISDITGKEEWIVVKWRKYVKLFTSVAVIVIMIFIVITAVVGIFIFRMIVKNMKPWGPVAAGMVNAVQIQILNAIYQKIAIALNNWENHRTQTEYEDMLIGKIFAFQFVNSYNALFYIAFFKKNANLFGNADECQNDDCLAELFVQTGCLIGTKIFVGNAMEVGVPYLLRWFRVRKELKSGKGNLTPAEYQAAMTPFKSTFDDFSEMVIQFGYVTLFVTAFPLGPLLAVINNVIEIRSDAYKFTGEFQRPFPDGAEDIGTWFHILEIMSTAAVLTNCAIFAFTTNDLQAYDWGDRLLVFVIAEHAILFIKSVIAFVIPDMPSATAKELQRQQHGILKHILGDEDDDDFMVEGLVTESDDEDEV